MERQLALEERMRTEGIERVQTRTEKANLQGRAHTTNYAKKLSDHCIDPFIEAIEHYMGTARSAGIYAKYKRMLALLPAPQLAHITMTDVFGLMLSAELPSVAQVAARIGTHIEDEVRFSRFRQLHPKYVQEILDDFKRKGTQNYRYMHRVLTYKANQLGDSWVPWNSKERVAVGMILIRLLTDSSSVVRPITITKMQRGKRITQWVLEYTQDTAEWIAAYTEQVGALQPVKLPCVVEPEDWEDQFTGGYYTPHMRRTVNFVKVSPIHRREHLDFIKSHPMQIPRAACNAIQRTPWKVNTKVLDVLTEVWKKNLDCGLPRSEPYEIPVSPLAPGTDLEALSDDARAEFMNWKHEARMLHTEERKRVAKACQLAATLKLAREFSTESKLYFPTQADFRGRLYAVTAGLSPQGPNFGKGVLEFAEGMPLGSGEKWWWVHGANVLGKDKVSFIDREAYMRQHADDWSRVAADPLGTRELWADADKPWQFLAWCFEVRDFCAQGGSFRSFLPMAQDGSCNGLQHFSAMLRDEIGGTATNLVDSDLPSDIYQRVADVVIKRLLMDSNPYAQKWLAFGISRKLVKKPVMTLPYGSTRQTCRLSLIDHVIKTDKGAFDNLRDAATYLTPIVWQSIGEVVIAARAAMDWLKEVGSLVAKSGSAMRWVNQAGFPVYQVCVKPTVGKIETVLLGRRVVLSVADTNSTSIDANRMKNGASPNFVHSCDAAHLTLTIKAAADTGMANFACIHDDYGTHAYHTEEFNSIIREQFYNMYKDRCVLSELKHDIEWNSSLDLPEVPCHGTLDLSKVLHSKYFFS